MKTFLGFTTGLFSGTLIGMAFMSILLIASEDFRNFVNVIVNDTGDT